MPLKSSRPPLAAASSGGPSAPTSPLSPQRSQAPQYAAPVAAIGERPFLHVLFYGDPGSKKSTTAASFPTPHLVCCFDPWGKDAPYLRHAKAIGVTPVSLIDNTYVRDVVGPGDELLIRLEYYLDEDVQQPRAWPAFQRRMHQIERDYWRTVTVDSMTMMEFSARKYAQYHLNPMRKGVDPRQWYAYSKEAIEEMAMGKLASLPMNVCLIAHVDEDKDEVHGIMLRNPAAPGKLSKRLPAGYSELYHAYVTKAEDGSRVFALQTESDNVWNAATQIQAPNPCWPDYEALWENWDRDRR